MENASESLDIVLTKYIKLINSSDFDAEQVPPAYTLPVYKGLWPLFARIRCIPATSAPVERVFSQSGILMRPHRAKMSDEVLEMLMFLKCNRHVESVNSGT